MSECNITFNVRVVTFVYKKRNEKTSFTVKTRFLNLCLIAFTGKITFY